jgi:integrase
MKGSLKQLGPNYWRFQVYAGQRTAAGNPRQSSLNFRGTRRQAESALGDFVAEVTREVRFDATQASVGELLKRWMDHQQTRCTKYTLADYVYKLDAHVRQALDKTKLAKLSAADLDGAYDVWLAKGLSPATVRKMANMVSAALNLAIDWGWPRTSPAARAHPPKVVKVDRGALPLSELQQLMREAETADGPGGVLPTAIALGAVTACRRGELCALRWSDVGTAMGSVTVRRALTVVQGDPTEGATKTGRTKHLALDVVALGVVLVDDPFVLSRDYDGSGPCLPDGLTHGFGRLVEQLWPRVKARAEEPRWHFHDLRHWAASTMVSAGVDIKTAQARGGSATTSMLLDVYAHVLSDRDREAAAGLGSALTLLASAAPTEAR